jgi:uncharacterized protein YndB with AHSA1/START domain
MAGEITVRIDIAASPEAVYQALTDGQQLEAWFAEHANVSLEDGRFGFWGRLTPETPSQPAGSQRLLRADHARQVRFEWQLRGEETTVSFDIRKKGPGTELNLVHFGLPTIKAGQYAVADFWSLSLENLRAWVERSEIGLQCDFSKIQLGEVQLEVDIEAPPETVFETLIDPEKLALYIAPDPVVEPEVGGRYDYGWGEGPVKILELEPNQKLSHSWQWDRTGEPETVVTWLLEGSEGKTRLTLVHSGFAPDRSMEDYQVGWLDFLQRIKFLSEHGTAWEKPEVSSPEYSGAEQA